MLPSELKNIIKKEALKAGFEDCGIARASFLSKDALRLEKWLINKQHANMKFMEKNPEKRLNPELLFSGTKSVISLLYNYNISAKQNPESFYRIARFAYLNDYHIFLKQKMKELISNLKNIIGNFNTKIFVDSAPILEKAWAVKSGLGNIGKNTQLIIPDKGSYFFLCEIFTDLEPEYDEENDIDYCGPCSKCIDACPTGAINDDKTINAGKCIAYLSIEHKSDIDTSLKESFANQIFGCDICLEVCPHNQKCPKNNENTPYINKGALMLSKADWENMTEDDFKNIFNNSSLFRTGYLKIKKNINFVKN